jgi:hypothetical protein
MRNFRGSDSPQYFGGGTALYSGGHGASCKMSAKGHLLSTLPCVCLHNYYGPSVEAHAIVATAAEALALRVHALSVEGPLLLTAVLLRLLFPTQFVVA